MDPVLAPTLPPARLCPLKAGVHCQVYCDTLRGEHHADKVRSFDAECARLAAEGFVGVFVHVFPGCTRADFEDYARVAIAHGLQCSVAFGLSDYQSHHAEQAARAMAAVVRSPLCTALALDAESGFENDPTDRAATVVLGRVLRAEAPDEYILDQPWPLPTVHASFPDAEFGAFIDASARQYYINDWTRQLGTARAAKLIPRFEAAVATVVHRLHLEHVRQLWTVQGYGFADVMADLVAILLKHADEPMLVWSEPEPDASFKHGLAAVAALGELGFRGAGAALAYQQWSNAQGFVHLDEDGRCGAKTLAALGLA